MKRLTRYHAGLLCTCQTVRCDVGILSHCCVPVTMVHVFRKVICNFSMVNRLQRLYRSTGHAILPLPLPYLMRLCRVFALLRRRQWAVLLTFVSVWGREAWLFSWRQHLSQKSMALPNPWASRIYIAYTLILGTRSCSEHLS